MEDILNKQLLPNTIYLAANPNKAYHRGKIYFGPNTKDNGSTLIQYYFNIIGELNTGSPSWSTNHASMFLDGIPNLYYKL